MTDETPRSESVPWWERPPPGKLIPLAFVKIDRKDATAEWSDLSAEEVARRQA